MRHHGDNMASVKKYNRSVILQLLHQHGALSRKRISELMSLTPAAITMIVSEMIQDGLIVEGNAEKTGGFAGRKEIPVMLSADSYIALGVSINLEELLLSATNLNGVLLFSRAIPFENGIAPEQIVEMIAANLPSLLAEHGIGSDKVMGIGVTVRGIVDMDTGFSVGFFGALSKLNNPLKEMINQRISCPVSIDNNVRGLLRAHLFFSEQFESGVFFVRCEKGIGAAILADARILNGASGMCSEFGHIPVVIRKGKPCKCGRAGCLETEASPSAMVEEAKAVFSKEDTPCLWKLAKGKPANISLALVMQAAQEDAAVKRIVETAAIYLANGIKGAICILDPSQVVLYGSVFESEYYMQVLHAHLEDGFHTRLQTTTVIKSPFNLKLESTAACVLAINAFFKSGGQISACAIG